MSEYMRDQPETPQERAIFWAEYVIKHKGAKHLQSAARSLNFLRYYCLDVITVLTLIMISISVGIYLFVRTVFKRVKRLCGSRVLEAKKKK